MIVKQDQLRFYISLKSNIVKWDDIELPVFLLSEQMCDIIIKSIKCLIRITIYKDKCKDQILVLILII